MLVFLCKVVIFIIFIIPFSVQIGNLSAIIEVFSTNKTINFSLSEKSSYLLDTNFVINSESFWLNGEYSNVSLVLNRNNDTKLYFHEVHYVFFSKLRFIIEDEGENQKKEGVIMHTIFLFFRSYQLTFQVNIDLKSYFFVKKLGV